MQYIGSTRGLCVERGALGMESGKADGGWGLEEAGWGCNGGGRLIGESCKANYCYSYRENGGPALSPCSAGHEIVTSD